MTTPLTPAGVKVQGNIKTIYVPTLSQTAPSLAAATGAGSLEITNILYADSGRYAVDSATGAAPRRLGTSRTWQQFGTATESFNGSLRYTIDPQGAAGSDGKKAYEKFLVGTVGFFLEVPGKDTDANLAIGDWGRVIPIKCGDPNIIGDPTDEFAEFTVEQAVIVTAPGAGALVQLVA